jgi:hypothetical protein
VLSLEQNQEATVPQSSAVTDPQGHGEDRSRQQTEAGLMPWDMPRFRNWIAVAKVHGLVEKAMAAGLAPLLFKLPHDDITMTSWPMSTGFQA